jgi:hypothetical protein
VTLMRRGSMGWSSPSLVAPPISAAPLPRLLRRSLLPPMWSPGPIDVPDPPIDIAAVNPWMRASPPPCVRREVGFLAVDGCRGPLKQLT